MQNTNYQEALKIFPDREVTYIEAFDFFSNSQKDALSELEHLIQISDTKNIANQLMFLGFSVNLNKSPK